MKKLVFLLVLVMVLSACGRETPVMETVTDEIAEQTAAEPKPMAVWLPDGAIPEN